MGIKVDLDECTGCGNCTSACPFVLIEIVEGKAKIKDGCTLCGACVDACDYHAITIEAPQTTAGISVNTRGVWVFAEQRRGNLKNVAFELLSKGRELADMLRTALGAVCLGHDIKDVDRLIAYGADN